jgi:multidrug efflux pump subunit AcrA (membrane-fusion protein)
MTEPAGGRMSPRVVMHLRRTRLAYFLAIVAAASVAGAAALVGGGDGATAMTTSRTVTVSNGVVQSTVSGSGNLAPLKQSELSFDQAGEITRVYVAEGEHVDAGEALLRLQPADETQAVTWIRAPFSGTVASLGVEQGDTVAGATAADAEAQVTLAKLSKYNLEVSLSESDIGKVEVGQMATVTVSATGDEYAATVTEVGVLAASDSASSGAVSYPVTLALTQSGAGLKPGMTASADIVTSQARGLTVPTQALRGETVTVVEGTTQTPTRVQTGVAGDATTQIVSGLKAGDKVLVTSTSAAAGASAAPTTTQPRMGGGFPGAGTAGPPAGGPPSGMGR